MGRRSGSEFKKGIFEGTRGKEYGAKDGQLKGSLRESYRRKE